MRGEAVSEACDAIAKCVEGMRRWSVAWHPASKAGVHASASHVRRSNEENEHSLHLIGMHKPFPHGNSHPCGRGNSAISDA